jgi:uncharacterized protein
MQCPKCNAPMEDVTYADITVERCTSCRGIWFDARKHVHLAAIKGSEAIDIGDPAVGKKYNQIGKATCPVCTSPMMRMVDVDQPHIWYESCKVCKGVFFDAAEFRDFKDHTIIDWFKDHFQRHERK